MFNRREWALVACLLSLAGSASAQVYRCVDSTGRQAFSDAPCAANAQSGAQVLGAGATQRLGADEEAAASQRNLQSIERARALQQDTVNASIGAAQTQAPGGLTPAPSYLTGAPTQPAPPADRAETYSPRRGGIGGSREVNPNWSPSRGYYGGGGPADQRHDAQQAARRAAAPGRMVCDKTGCWGSNNGIRYESVGGGHLKGPDGVLCRKAGDRFHCD